MKRNRKWDDDPRQLPLFGIFPTPLGLLPWQLLQAIQEQIESEEIEREHGNKASKLIDIPTPELNPDFFNYPKTDIFLGDGEIAKPIWPPIGLMRHLGYVVGLEGKARTQRQAILTMVFEIEMIPKLTSAEYVAAWGSACSSARLKKLADSIAAFCRNAKRRQQKNGAFLKHAIENWEDDLAWLKTKYYDGKFDNKFLWPSC